MITRSEKTTAARPSLTLFCGEDSYDQTADNGLRTLRDCYEEFLVPDFRSDQTGTQSAYHTALNHWAAYTGDPPYYEINSDSLRMLRDGMLDDGYSPETVMKTYRHLRPIFRRIGPWGHGNPQGEDLIARVPYMKPLPRLRKTPRVVEFDIIDRLYRACEIATWPKRTTVPAPTIYRAALVAFLNYGPRTFDLLGVAADAFDWRGDLFIYRAAKTSKLHALPMNHVTRRHFALLLENGDQPFRIASRGRFYKQWRAINREAGISDEDYVEPRQLRETCDTLYERIKPGIGKWVLGHTPQDVNSRHYYNPSQEIWDAVQAFPQPESFLRGCE